MVISTLLWCILYSDDITEDDGIYGNKEFTEYIWWTSCSFVNCRKKGLVLKYIMEFYYKISLHIERRLKPHKYGIVEVVKSGKKQRNVGNSYFIPAPLLHHYSYT